MTTHHSNFYLSFVLLFLNNFYFKNYWRNAIISKKQSGPPAKNVGEPLLSPIFQWDVGCTL